MQANAKLKSLSLFISLSLILKKAFDNVKKLKRKVRVVSAIASQWTIIEVGMGSTLLSCFDNVNKVTYCWRPVLRQGPFVQLTEWAQIEIA